MESLTLIFSAAVAISTVVYAVLTWKLTAETRLMRRAGTQPGLSVHIEAERYRNVIVLVIQNHGRGVARNVTWTISPSSNELTTFGVDLRPLKLLDGLSQIAPGQRIVTFFGIAFKMLGCPSINVIASYEDELGEKLRTTFVLSPAQFEGLTSTGDSVEEEIVTSLKKIARVLDNVTRSGKLHVATSAAPPRSSRAEHARLTTDYDAATTYSDEARTATPTGQRPEAVGERTERGPERPSAPITEDHAAVHVEADHDARNDGAS